MIRSCQGTSDRLIGYTRKVYALAVCLRPVAAYIHQSKYKQKVCNVMARHGTAWQLFLTFLVGLFQCCLTAMPLSPARTYVYATFHCVNLLCISFCTTCNLAFANKMDWKSLGVILDQRLTFNEHATAVVKSCNYHARAIRHVRHLLTESVAQTLACSLINSRLDYCNSLLYGAPEATMYLCKCWS